MAGDGEGDGVGPTPMSMPKLPVGAPPPLAPSMMKLLSTEPRGGAAGGVAGTHGSPVGGGRRAGGAGVPDAGEAAVAAVGVAAAGAAHAHAAAADVGGVGGAGRAVVVADIGDAFSRRGVADG